MPLSRAFETSATPIVFGKLPNRPDFIRVNAAHPAAAEFDERLQAALRAFCCQPGWETAYDETPATLFCCPSRDQRWVFAGAWRNSRDQSMRRYPLAAGIAFPAAQLGTGGSLVPIACEVFFEGLREQLANALDNSVEALACRQFLEGQAAAWNPGLADLPLAVEIVGRFMDDHPPSVLEVPQVATCPERLALMLMNITFYRDFRRRFPEPSAAQVIELPLAGGPGEAPLQASAWLTLLMAIAGDQEPWHGGFLLRHGPEGAALHASFGLMPWQALVLA
ncbi:MAG TPA: type VI secretion system-associated protein TagF, partial [Holophaga sp.]|nr:type VI secretion system-associated protein TagF [Holophaga sp.]